MRCTNCGNENKDTYLFCTKCGKPLVEEQENKKELKDVSPFRTDEVDYHYERTVWMGQWSKTIKTAVLVGESCLEISQVSQAIIGKSDVKEHKVAYDKISSADVKYKPTKWQLGLGVIAAFYMVMGGGILWGGLAALLIWMSLGYEIEIKTTSGENYTIPTKSKSEEVFKLLNLIPRKKARS